VYAGFVCSGPGRQSGVCVSSHGFGRDSGKGNVSVTPSRLFDTHVRTNPEGHISGPALGSTYVSLDRVINRDDTRTRAKMTIRITLRFIKIT
jgi:hypothetical protein